jgi:hypothetical protein
LCPRADSDVIGIPFDNILLLCKLFEGIIRLFFNIVELGVNPCVP